MKWVRCPSCRTLNDVDRYLMCDGCSRDLSGVPPAQEAAPARNQQTARRDSISSNRLAWLIAGLLLFGTFILPLGVSCFTAVVSFVLLGVLFVTLGVRYVRDSSMGLFLKVVGTFLAVAAGIVGAAILVFIACAAKAHEVRL